MKDSSFTNLSKELQESHFKLAHSTSHLQSGTYNSEINLNFNSLSQKLPREQ
jgi:hypothetical protein